MQAIDFIELYVAATFAIAAFAVVVEFIAMPLTDLIQRFAPEAKKYNLATVHDMPKPAAKKNYKDWDTMQLDAAA